jgi:hypothetical protein
LVSDVLEDIQSLILDLRILEGLNYQNFELLLWLLLRYHVSYKICTENFRVVYKSLVLHNVGQQRNTSGVGLRMSESSIQKV